MPTLCVGRKVSRWASVKVAGNLGRSVKIGQHLAGMVSGQPGVWGEVSR